MAANPLAEFEALSDNRPKLCVIGRALTDDRLDQDDRGKLRLALDAPHIADNSIAKWLRLRGLKHSHQTVRRHRDGECCCA